MSWNPFKRSNPSTCNDFDVDFDDDFDFDFDFDGVGEFDVGAVAKTGAVVVGGGVVGTAMTKALDWVMKRDQKVAEKSTKMVLAELKGKKD